MPRTIQRVHLRSPQSRPELLQQETDGIDLILNLSVQTAKLRYELVVKGDRPTRAVGMMLSGL